jgi:two-component system invasion response regulator UvrY
MIQVLAVDDHSFTRSGIRQVLGREGDFAPMDDAADDPEALQRIAQGVYDVVVLDLGLPGRSGLETLAEIRRRYPALPVLILSAYPEKQFAIRALKAGASGYLTKTASPGLLVHAIRQVAGGRRYIGPEIAEMLASALNGGRSAEALHESLSEREFEVMRAIATGKTVSGIARDLSLSVKTISTYRARALEKMSMRNNAEFTYYAVRSGLVD